MDLVSRPAIFLDRDGVLNEPIPYINSVEKLIVYPFVSNTIKKINESQFLAVVITNQPVIARNDCTVDVLNQIHKKLETEVGRFGAKLDGLYYCPHSPDFEGQRNELNINCDCRKPEIDMVKRAQKDLNIDLNLSYIIGDSTRDICCGNRAGLKTVGVRTGNACNDGKYQCEINYMFDNVEEAVDFILGVK